MLTKKSKFVPLPDALFEHKRKGYVFKRMESALNDTPLSDKATSVQQAWSRFQLQWAWDRSLLLSFHSIFVYSVKSSQEGFSESRKEEIERKVSLVIGFSYGSAWFVVPLGMWLLNIGFGLRANLDVLGEVFTNQPGAGLLVDIKQALSEVRERVWTLK